MWNFSFLTGISLKVVFPDTISWDFTLTWGCIFQVSTNCCTPGISWYYYPISTVTFPLIAPLISRSENSSVDVSTHCAITTAFPAPRVKSLAILAFSSKWLSGKGEDIIFHISRHPHYATGCSDIICDVPVNNYEPPAAWSGRLRFLWPYFASGSNKVSIDCPSNHNWISCKINIIIYNFIFCDYEFISRSEFWSIGDRWKNNNKNGKKQSVFWKRTFVFITTHNGIYACLFTINVGARASISISNIFWVPNCLLHMIFTLWLYKYLWIPYMNFAEIGDEK